MWEAWHHCARFIIQVTGAASKIPIAIIVFCLVNLTFYFQLQYVFTNTISDFAHCATVSPKCSSTDLHFGGGGSGEGGEFFCAIALNALLASFMRSLASSLFLLVFLYTCMSGGSVIVIFIHVREGSSSSQNYHLTLYTESVPFPLLLLLSTLMRWVLKPFIFCTICAQEGREKPPSLTYFHEFFSTLCPSYLYHGSHRVLRYKKLAPAATDLLGNKRPHPST